MGISFLFGSGADTDACNKLKSGQGFSEVLLNNRYSNEIEKLTGIKASHFRLIYPTSSKVFIQTIVTDDNNSRDAFKQLLSELREITANVNI